MHNFNNKKEIDKEKQTKWAAKNLERINELRSQIEKHVEKNL
jgi:hypothetical protein